MCMKHGMEEFEACNVFPCSFNHKEYGGQGKLVITGICILIISIYITDHGVVNVLYITYLVSIICI